MHSQEQNINVKTWWCRQSRLLGIGTGSEMVFAVVEQSDHEPFKWSAKIGSMLLSNGYSHYIYDTEEEARKGAMSYLTAQRLPNE